MYVGITRVKPLENFELEITFENSERKIFDLKPYLSIGIFSELKYEKLFKTVHINFDTIEWNNGADLDPEVIYEEGISVPAKTIL